MLIDLYPSVPAIQTLADNHAVGLSHLVPIAHPHYLASAT